MAKFRNIDISIVVDAVKNSIQYFDTLKDIKPIVDSDGVPHFYVGASATLFKVKYKGAIYALKCYDYCDEDKTRSLQRINSYFSKFDSSYITIGEILLDELTISNHNNEIYSLPIEMHPWIEGESISSALDRAIYFGDSRSITTLIDKLLKLSLWLIEQDFAHGDIKGDNIILKNNGELTLIDFNNAFIEGFFSPPLYELGTDGFRHPYLDEQYYNSRLDDYPLLIVITTLLVAERSIEFYSANSSGDFTIFNTSKLIDGRCENYIKAKELFNDTIIESRVLSLLESRLPSVTNLAFWLKALSEWRETNSDIACDIFECDTTMKFGLSDSEGKTVVPAIFDSVTRHSSDLYAVKIDGKWGVIDSKREIVVEINRDYISNIREGRLVMKSSGKFAYFDAAYSQITPFMFDNANSYHEGYAVVSIDNKYGYINLEGEFVVKPTYDFAYNIRDSVATVRIDDKIENLTIIDD